MEQIKERGALLTIWLIIMLILNSLLAIIYFFFGSIVLEAFPNVPAWAIYLFGLLTLINVVFAILLFRWKKWAFFGLCVVAIISFVINIFIGVGIFSSFLGLLSPIILYLIMKPKWQFFN
ncbi:MAG: hypothetical protein ABIG28_02140 [archaeon]